MANVNNTTRMANTGTTAVNDIMDIKGPVLFPSNAKLFLLLFAVIIGVLLGVFIRKVIKEMRERAGVVSKKNPYEIANEELEALTREDFIGKKLLKEYYTRLSDIIRKYVEVLFQVRAPEMTTEEFLATLSVGDILDGTHKDLIKEFLQYCDYVKFAKYSPSVSEINSTHKSAKEFIDWTWACETEKLKKIEQNTKVSHEFVE